MKKRLVVALVVSTIFVILLLLGFYKIYSYISNEERVENCANAGEYLPSGFAIETEDTKTECCAGLRVLSTQEYDEKDDKCYYATDSPLFCSDCGNGKCEEWENPCNCRDDCTIAVD